MHLLSHSPQISIQGRLATDLILVPIKYVRTDAYLEVRNFGILPADSFYFPATRPNTLGYAIKIY